MWAIVWTCLFILRLSYLFFRWLCFLSQNFSLSLHHHRFLYSGMVGWSLFIMSISRSKLYRCNMRARSVFLLFFFSAFLNVFLFIARWTIIIAGRTIIIAGRTFIIAKRTSFSTNFLPLSLTNLLLFTTKFLLSLFFPVFSFPLFSGWTIQGNDHRGKDH